MEQIDILTEASGLQFDAAFENAAIAGIEGLPIHIPFIDDLIRNKTASGRTKDMPDAEALEKIK